MGGNPSKDSYHCIKYPHLKIFPLFLSWRQLFFMVTSTLWMIFNNGNTNSNKNLTEALQRPHSDKCSRTTRGWSVTQVVWRVVSAVGGPVGADVVSATGRWRRWSVPRRPAAGGGVWCMFSTPPKGELTSRQKEWYRSTPTCYRTKQYCKSGLFFNYPSQKACWQLMLL